MKIGITAAIAFAAVFGLAATPGWAAAKPTHAAAGKAAPSCAALAFRPVPAGASDGEQSAGMYRSRFARLELRASIKSGAPANYYIMVGVHALQRPRASPRRPEIVQP